MEDLKRYCEHYDESYPACLCLLAHLLSTEWNEDEAIEHIKELIVSGVFDEIRSLLNYGENSMYQVGDKIKIINMKDEPQYEGKEGIIEHIDSIGQLHGTWGGCAIIPEIDEFTVPNLLFGTSKSYTDENGCLPESV